MKNLISYQDCAGNNIFRESAYVISMHSNPVWRSIEHEIVSFLKSFESEEYPASSFLKDVFFHSNLSFLKYLRRKK